MKAIVVTDQAAGTAGMKLSERPEPAAAINDVVVQVHASGFTVVTWSGTLPVSAKLPSPEGGSPVT
jgi:NADPH:quinone reductase-like Zn-dependent oxidoreductase